jgi:MraZ protein
MSQFLGTHQNRLDAKGRVSVPASFRAELKKLDAQGTLVLRPSHSHACIEVWPVPVFETLEKPLQELPDFSEEQIDLAATIYAGACRLEADKDGRVMLPASPSSDSAGCSRFGSPPPPPRSRPRRANGPMPGAWRKPWRHERFFPHAGFAR